MAAHRLIAKAIGIIINNPEFSDVLSLEGVAPTHQNVCRLSPFQLPQVQPQKSRLTMSLPMKRKRKFVCVDVHDVPAVALVDPDMMESMPKSLAAATGMDAHPRH